MGLLTSNKQRDAVLAASDTQQGMYGQAISDYEAKSEAMLADTMKGFEEEQSLYKKKRGYRDPMAEFAMQSGLRAQQQGAATKAAQATGLRSSGAFAQGQIAGQAAAQGYQQEVSRRAQNNQRNTMALHDLMKTSGSIKSQMQMSQLQGVSSMRSQQIQSYGAMQSQAAQLADQPTMLAGMIEGGIAAWAGGGMPGLSSLGSLFGGGGGGNLMQSLGGMDMTKPLGLGNDFNPFTNQSMDW